MGAIKYRFFFSHQEGTQRQLTAFYCKNSFEVNKVRAKTDKALTFFLKK